MLVPIGTGGGYCETHAYKAAASAQRRKRYVCVYDNHRGSAAERGYGVEWQRMRLIVLSMQPHCDMCGAPATEVHHIVPVNEGGPLLAWDNVVPLCHKHHMQIERKNWRG